MDAEWDLVADVGKVLRLGAVVFANGYRRGLNKRAVYNLTLSSFALKLKKIGQALAHLPHFIKPKYHAS